MVPIWHHFANSFYLIFIIFRWNYTFWWKDHVKKATVKAKRAPMLSMLYNLQPFLKKPWFFQINGSYLLPIRTIDLENHMHKHILIPREGSNMVNVLILWPSRLSCWTFLTIEGRIWIRKLISFECGEKYLGICPKLSCNRFLALL